MDRFVRVGPVSGSARAPLDHLHPPRYGAADAVRPALTTAAPRIVAYTVNRIGTWFGMVALSLAVFDHTHSGLAVAALLICSQALPAFMVPAVVARVEASRQRSELSALYAIEAVATAALAVLLWNFWLPGILLLVALDGTAALAASALLRTEAARVARAELDAPDEHEAEQKANAALNVAFSATFVAGPALAGVVVAACGRPDGAVHRRRLVPAVRRCSCST